MLEEGHCLSKQFVNYCKLKANNISSLNSNLQTGSLDTLLHLVEAKGGITIIPELAARQLDEDRKEKVRGFKSPVPVRKISLVTYRQFAKARLNNALKQHITQAVHPLLPTMKTGSFEVVGV